MTRFTRPLLATLLAALPCVAAAQAPTPEDHPGYALAEAIAAQGCVLHQDDVNGVLEGLGLDNAAFPQMAVPLMQTGFLRPGGEGRLELVNWGLCTEGAAEEADAQPDVETTDTETE